MRLIRLVACRLKARMRLGANAIRIAPKSDESDSLRAPRRKTVRGYSLDERLASRAITQRSR